MIWYVTNEVVVITNSYGVLITNGVLTVNAGGQLALTLTNQAHNPGSFNNYASVSAATPDPNPDDDSASTNINVSSVAPPVQYLDFCVHPTAHSNSPSPASRGRNILFRRPPTC